MNHDSDGLHHPARRDKSGWNPFRLRRSVCDAHLTTVRRVDEVLSGNYDRDNRDRFPFPVPRLADFEPKGAVAKLYGVYRQGEGTSERALFVIDADGVIRWSYVSPVGVNPGADGILSALEELQSKSEAK